MKAKKSDARMKGAPSGTGNRTGMTTSRHAADAIEGASVMPPSSDGDETAIAAVLAEYGKEAIPVGTVPPGQRKTAPILADKLGERLAFERTGVRLYDALIAKLDALGAYEGGPTREELEHIRDEEADHFLMVAEMVEKLGGDPTVMTPAADIQGVASTGIGQVVCDPRTTLPQALEAILVAELTDVDAWKALIDLAGELGEEMAPSIDELERAHQEELEHLAKVRRWVKAAMQLRAGTTAAAAE